jgi:Tfp pilus assembly protein PilZ
MAAEHAAMAPEGAKPLGKQFQHMLTRAMGVEETVEADICEIEMLKNDVLVICSDGLSDNVSPEEIGDIAVKEPPDQACRSLVDLSNERRGHDNITVIVVKIKDLLDDGPLLEMDEPAIEMDEPAIEMDEPAIEMDEPAIEMDEPAIEMQDDVSLEKPKITVEYDTEDGSYQSVVQRINFDGVFIETGESFSIGQEVMMTFSIGEEHLPLMVNGEVVSRSPEGIEVKFESLAPEDQEIIKSLMEKM